MPNHPVHLGRQSDVALILVDHPPVNALSEPVCEGLLQALAEVARDPALRAAVIACDGPGFIAGTDAHTRDPVPGEATLDAVLGALDGGSKPVVAAIQGAALGSGFGLALACHARIIAPDGTVGFPELRVGILPGAGSTQRTVRLVGPIVALELITSSRPMPADEAMTLGLVDEVATDLRRAAIARARQLADAGQLPLLADRAVPAGDHAAFEAAATAVRLRAHGAQAPISAIEVVEAALELPFAEGLAREQALNRVLRQGPQAKALRHMVHAERVAARPPAETTGWPLRRVGVVGGGSLGGGIAAALADAGLDVTLVADDAAKTAAEAHVRAGYDRQLHGGRLSERLHAERVGRIRFVASLPKLQDCDVVIEAAGDDLEAKRAVFRALSPVVRRNTVLASNTGFLPIDQLADGVDAPERVIGLHPVNPAHPVRLLEIVRDSRAWPEVLATALALARRLNKVAVVARAGIGDRLLARWRAQCDYALEDGALPDQVDAALEAYGFAMGLFALSDRTGLDAACRARAYRAATRAVRERTVPVLEWLYERGHFGLVSGRGYYLYQNGNRLPDPAVADLVVHAAALRGITRRTLPAVEIQQRVHAALVDEGARIVAEGIAARPSDIDVVMVHGFGYPAWRGGPMHEADTVGVAVVLQRVEALYAASGSGWEPAPLLREMAAAGKRFADLNG